MTLFSNMSVISVFPHCRLVKKKSIRRLEEKSLEEIKNMKGGYFVARGQRNYLESGGPINIFLRYALLQTSTHSMWKI